MKKNLFITSSILLLMSILLASGCAQNSKQSGTDWYQADLYRKVPAAEHEKRFPHGHEKKAGDDKNIHCYGEVGTAGYFCQYWDDWDE